MLCDEIKISLNAWGYGNLVGELFGWADGSAEARSDMISNVRFRHDACTHGSGQVRSFMGVRFRVGYRTDRRQR